MTSNLTSTADSIINPAIFTLLLDFIALEHAAALNQTITHLSPALLANIYGVWDTLSAHHEIGEIASLAPVEGVMRDVSTDAMRVIFDQPYDPAATVQVAEALLKLSSAVVTLVKFTIKVGLMRNF